MREQVPCPKCGSRVQQQYMRKHDKNMHQGGRRRIHVCPYCSATRLPGLEESPVGQTSPLHGGGAGRERVRFLTTPRPQGQGERRIDRGGGAAKRPRMESSSGWSPRQQGRVGGVQVRQYPGATGARWPAGCPTHDAPRRPPPPSTSPRRSPWLSRPGLTNDFRRLPLSAKSELDGRKTNRAYERVRTLRKQYGQYKGQGEGQPSGLPSTIRLPHTKGTTPDKDTIPTALEPAESEHGESGPEEGEVQQEEGDDPGSFTKIWSRETDTESEDTTPGWESWRSTRGRETVLLTTPRPQGRGKRQMDHGCGAAKRPRMESSSSDCRDDSEESRSGSTQERPRAGWEFTLSAKCLDQGMTTACGGPSSNAPLWGGCG